MATRGAGGGVEREGESEILAGAEFVVGDGGFAGGDEDSEGGEGEEGCDEEKCIVRVGYVI